MKLLSALVLLISLSACGEYGDKLDRKMIKAYTDDCVSKGYSKIEITYIMGKPSAYYRCL